ncbi:MAG: hypothetical protein JW941_05875 [Candidatus Coatesbacteria bacterium]|nr:hypothetical protein [Candidatus Coatesbacteria bacterium]
MLNKSIRISSSVRQGAFIVALFAMLFVLAADCRCSQDNFTFTYFRYRDENDTINNAFTFRLDRQVLDKTKLKLSYLHSDTRYWKIPLWEPATRNYSYGDQYSLQVEQKTVKDGKLVLGYTYTDRAIRLTDAYLIHEMEKKAKEDPDVGGLRKPTSHAYTISYSQPLFDQNTTIEGAYSHTDANLTPYWEYDITTYKYLPGRTTSYTNSYTLTVTQIITKMTMCQLSASYATQSALPETWSWSAKVNQYFPTRTSLQVYYRYSLDGDSFYTNTFEAKVYQYIIDEILVMVRYRWHGEDDPSLDEDQEWQLWQQQEYGDDLSVSLFPGESVTIGGAVIIDILGLAGCPSWLGGDYVDKINLDLRYNNYRHNSKFEREYYLDADMYSAGIGVLF